MGNIIDKNEDCINMMELDDFMRDLENNRSTHY